MNIILVEDEPPILREIEHYIKKFGEPYHILDTATDGQNAKELIDKYQNKIDFLLTDIQIPVINGLELIEYGKSRYPDIICSVLTGYNEFAYVQKALRLKILDYILKPIDPEALHNHLKEVYEQKCLYHAKAEIITGYSDTISLSGELSLNYREILINIGPLSYIADHVPDEITSSGDSELLEETLQAFSSYFLKYWIIRDKNCHTYFILFSFRSNQLQKCHSFYYTLYEALTQRFPVVTVILNEERITLDNINSSIQKLNKFAGKRILFLQSSFLRFSDEENPENYFSVPKDFAPIDNIMRLSKLFTNNSRDMFHTELQHFIRQLASHPIRQKTLTNYLLTLYTECSLPCLHYDAVQQIEPYHILDDIIMLSDSYESLYINLVSIFDDILATIVNETGNSSGKSNIFVQINDYINKHYTETINTRTLADKFGFTPAYLSKLFREYKKLTPAEYISSLRISKAKELLKSNRNLSVKEVADVTGYDDPLYFGKVFKKLVGITPKAYQLEQNK